MTLSEWYKAAKELPPEKAQALTEALETLRGWETFDKEFSWTGIFEIHACLQGSTVYSKVTCHRSNSLPAATGR